MSTPGMITTDIGSLDYGSSVTIQTNGKILIAGYSDIGFALVRYNSNGSLDTTFSGDGKLTTDFGDVHDDPRATVQTDGKILVAGGSYKTDRSNSDFALARYNTDGSLDTTFSDDGKLTTDFGSWGLCYSVTVQVNGKILVAGEVEAEGSDMRSYFGLARYNTNGSLDTTFSSDGKLTTDFSNESWVQAWANSVIVDATGKILVSGAILNEDLTRGVALARYNTNGSLDTTFSSDGKLTTDFGGRGYGDTSMFVQTDGKILVAGTAEGVDNEDQTDFALARYNTDGSLDTTFSDDGKLTTDLGSFDYGYSVTVQTNGKILVAGVIANEDLTSSVALVRYNTDGSFDTTFSDDGKLITDWDTDWWSTVNVTVQTDGKILVAGNVNNEDHTDSDFALIRYNSDGTLDSTFDVNAPIPGLTVNGDSKANNLFGSDNNDTFTGGGSADTFNIVAGDDIITDLGSGGADILKVSAGASVEATVTAAWTATAKTVINGHTFLQTSGLRIDVSKATGNYGFELLNEGGATFLIGSKEEDYLLGGAGNDTLTGGKGDDDFYVTTAGGTNTITDLGNGSDTLMVAIGSRANATIYAAWTAESYTSNDGTVNISTKGFAVNVSASTGGSGYTITNTGAATRLTGSDSDDVLNGLKGNDTLVGGAGSDILKGGAGADSITGGNGHDTFLFAKGDSGQKAGAIDNIVDYYKGVSGVGDLIDFSNSNLAVGGSSSVASVKEASISSNGIATFASGSGTTLADALADIATRFTASTNSVGEFAFFKIAGSGDYNLFISDGVKGVGANDVVIQLVGVSSISGIDLTGGNLTITG